MPYSGEWHWPKCILTLLVGCIFAVNGETILIRTDCSGETGCYTQIDSTVFDGINADDTIDIGTGVFNVAFDINVSLDTK